jgi:hypothetical protein
LNLQKTSLSQTKIIKVNDLEISRNELVLREIIINVEKFKLKVRQHIRFWRYYEIKSCLKRYDETSGWKILFLYVRLLPDRATIVQEGINTVHLKLIHESGDINSLLNLLNQIVSGKRAVVGGESASLEWITNRMIFDTYYESHPHTSVFGIFEPSHTLTQTGDSSAETKTNERISEGELQNHDPPYESLEDAVHSFLNICFWSDSLLGAYFPFIVVSAPIPIKITNTEFSNKHIKVILDCAPETEVKSLKATLFGLH